MLGTFAQSDHHSLKLLTTCRTPYQAAKSMKNARKRIQTQKLTLVFMKKQQNTYLKTLTNL